LTQSTSWSVDKMVVNKSPPHCQTVNAYHVHVQMAYKRIYNSKPEAMAIVKNNTATIAKANAEGINDMT
jgi:hypothetical protein